MSLQYWKIDGIFPFPMNGYSCTAGRTLFGLFMAARNVKLEEKLYCVFFFIDALLLCTERYRDDLYLSREEKYYQ